MENLTCHHQRVTTSSTGSEYPARRLEPLASSRLPDLKVCPGLKVYGHQVPPAGVVRCAGLGHSQRS